MDDKKLICGIVGKLTAAGDKLAQETFSLTKARELIEDALMLAEQLAQAHNIDPYEVTEF